MMRSRLFRDESARVTGVSIQTLPWDTPLLLLTPVQSLRNPAFSDIACLCLKAVQRLLAPSEKAFVGLVVEALY